MLGRRPFVAVTLPVDAVEYGKGLAADVVGRRLGVLFGLLLIAAQLVGCGHGASPVVVQIGDTAITKAAVNRWTAIEAAVTYDPNPRKPVPKGAIPDPPGYEGCIAYSRTTSTAGGKLRTTQLRRECRNQYSVLQHQILEILITTNWLTTEGARVGIRVTDAEARRVLHEKFKTKAAVQRFLTFTGEKEDDEVFLLKRTMLADRMAASFRGQGRSSAQAEKAQIAFFTQLVKKWTAKTSCRAGYVVSQCRQYDAK